MAQETLLFRWAGFSPALWLLIPAFSLGNAPQFLTELLRRDTNAPLPLHKGRIQCKAHIFGNMLSPVTFSARDLLTSELLRTL